MTTSTAIAAIAQSGRAPSPYLGGRRFKSVLAAPLLAIGYLGHVVLVAPAYTDSDSTMLRTDEFWRKARF